MMKKIHILYVLVFLMGTSCFAQEKLITKANEKYDEYSFSPAIDIYKKVLDRGYVSADLLKKLGNSYYYNADYEDASKTYKRLVDEYPGEIGPEYYFRYAQTLKTLEEYDASKEVMGKFLEATSE
ncbi:tol-pal system YbgF family protein [Zobellia russellii]|uniref:tol-pal system YbgF family protein n=1 Tax=Zobellia russellii TaxID=248907 RepID=UPI0037DC9ABB